MLEEKLKDMYCYEVYNSDGWTVCLRKRCNPHPGEPDMKVWVCQYGREVAQFTNKYRGYGRYKGDENEKLLPKPVRKAARKAWRALCEGKYTEEKLDELRVNYLENLAPAQ